MEYSEQLQSQIMKQYRDKIPQLMLKNGQAYRGYNAFRSISANFREHSIQYYKEKPQRETQVEKIQKSIQSVFGQKAQKDTKHKGSRSMSRFSCISIQKSIKKSRNKSKIDNQQNSSEQIVQSQSGQDSFFEQITQKMRNSFLSSTSNNSQSNNQNASLNNESQTHHLLSDKNTINLDNDIFQHIEVNLQPNIIGNQQQIEESKEEEIQTQDQQVQTEYQQQHVDNVQEKFHIKQQKISYPIMQNPLPFDIKTCFVFEANMCYDRLKKQFYININKKSKSHDKVLLLFPLSLHHSKNLLVYSQVWTALYRHQTDMPPNQQANGKDLHLQIDIDTLEKRTNIPQGMDHHSKVVHVKSQRQIWILDGGVNKGSSSKIFQIYDYYLNKWPANPFQFKFAHIGENEKNFMGSTVNPLLPGPTQRVDNFLDCSQNQTIIFALRKYVYYYTRKYNYGNNVCNSWIEWKYACRFKIDEGQVLSSLLERQESIHDARHRLIQKREDMFNDRLSDQASYLNLSDQMINLSQSEIRRQNVQLRQLSEEREGLNEETDQGKIFQIMEKQKQCKQIILQEESKFKRLSRETNNRNGLFFQTGHIGNMMEKVIDDKTNLNKEELEQEQNEIESQIEYLELDSQEQQDSDYNNKEEIDYSVFQEINSTQETVTKKQIKNIKYPNLNLPAPIRTENIRIKRSKSSSTKNSSKYDNTKIFARQFCQFNQFKSKFIQSNVEKCTQIRERNKKLQHEDKLYKNEHRFYQIFEDGYQNINDDILCQLVHYSMGYPPEYSHDRFMEVTFFHVFEKLDLLIIFWNHMNAKTDFNFLKYSFFEVIKINFHRSTCRQNGNHWQFIYRSTIVNDQYQCRQTKMNVYDFNGMRGFDIGSFSNLNKIYQGKKINNGHLKEEAEKLNNLLFKNQILNALKKKDGKNQDKKDQYFNSSNSNFRSDFDHIQNYFKFRVENPHISTFQMKKSFTKMQNEIFKGKEKIMEVSFLDSQCPPMVKPLSAYSTYGECYAKENYFFDECYDSMSQSFLDNSTELAVLDHKDQNLILNLLIPTCDSPLTGKLYFFKVKGRITYESSQRVDKHIQRFKKQIKQINNQIKSLENDLTKICSGLNLDYTMEKLFQRNSEQVIKQRYDLVKSIFSCQLSKMDELLLKIQHMQINFDDSYSRSVIKRTNIELGIFSQTVLTFKKRDFTQEKQVLKYRMQNNVEQIASIYSMDPKSIKRRFHPKRCKSVENNIDIIRKHFVMMTKYEQYLEKKPNDKKIKIVKRKKRTQSCKNINQRPFIEYYNNFKECYDFFIPFNQDISNAFEASNHFEEQFKQTKDKFKKQRKGSYSPDKMKKQNLIQIGQSRRMNMPAKENVPNDTNFTNRHKIYFKSYKDINLQFWTKNQYYNLRRLEKNLVLSIKAYDECQQNSWTLRGQFNKNEKYIKILKKRKARNNERSIGRPQGPYHKLFNHYELKCRDLYIQDLKKEQERIYNQNKFYNGIKHLNPLNKQVNFTVKNSEFDIDNFKILSNVEKEGFKKSNLYCKKYSINGNNQSGIKHQFPMSILK